MSSSSRGSAGASASWLNTPGFLSNCLRCCHARARRADGTPFLHRSLTFLYRFSMYESHLLNISSHFFSRLLMTSTGTASSLPGTGGRGR
ncbi:hypothetical protein E2C01_037520 [Portunus trituberculatus]|uniref:Uncharacterized protein n=1 Tax=Portunus trituberculatus TaxID=210409 RepID=A0A5B7FFV5_PORTR|nr:hypothetical protein [Portunus trituberculatus]